MLNRRSFIRKSGALAALSMGSYTGLTAGLNTKTGLEDSPKKERNLPQRLKRGDLIGLVTPGGPIHKEQLDETIVKLENLGFKSVHDIRRIGLFIVAHGLHRRCHHDR